MKKIAIIGLGLIGGSLGLRLKARGYKVIGIPRREETLKLALEMGAIDEGSLDISKVSEAEVVFICTPINLIIPRLNEIIPHIKKGTIVTDVASTKSQIVSQADKIMPAGAFFVGGHPMAGKELAGIGAAEPGLFEGKTWILAETSKTKKAAMDGLEGIIKETGANILELDPKTHDRVVAAISHIPLAAAASLVNLVADQEDKDLMVKCASSGFRDTTRIASGDPVLGRDIFDANRAAVLKMLKDFRAKILDLEKIIKTGDLSKIEAELRKAKDFRDSIFGS